MPRRSCLAALAAAVLLVAIPPAASAQLDVFGACTPGSPACGSFDFFMEATDRPVVLQALELEFLTPGWAFAPGSILIEDVWGPYSNPTSTGGSTLFVDFMAPGFFEMEMAPGWPGLVRTDVVAGAGTPDFGWTAVEIDGNVLAGATGPTDVVPEPSTFVLLGTGLLGLAGLARRRGDDEDSAGAHGETD